MNKRALDVLLLWAVLVLMGLGIVMVYSASSVNAAARLGDPAFFLKRQAVFAALGVCLLVVGTLVPPQWWKQAAVPLLVVTALLLVAVKIPGLGRTAGGAQRWLQFGSFGMQPSELAKLTLVNFLAYSLHKKQDKLADFRVGFVNHSAVTLVFVLLLMLQPDFGTSMVLVLLAGMLMLLGGVRLRFMLAGIAALLPFAAVLVMSSEYRRNRVLAFFDPWSHRSTIGYQITESLISFGSGGITGLGLGAGKQKLFFLPAAHTDFIFAIIGEELGLLGVLVTVGMFVLIGWRGLEAFKRLGLNYRGLLAAGLTLLIVCQGAFNMCVVLGLVPNKGITLPFVSYGGSSLLAFCLMAGVLLRLCGEPAEVDNTSWSRTPTGRWILEGVTA